MMTIDEYLSTPYSENPDSERCGGCSTMISGTVTGRNQTDEGVRCDDCYFDDLGDLVEKHPVGKG